MASLEARLHDYLRAVEDAKRNGLKLVPGVGTAQGIKPWQQSARPGRGLESIPFEADARMSGFQGPAEEHQVDWSVAPIRRRSNQERLAAVTQQIYSEALRSYQQVGRVEFPRSVLLDIQQKFWEAGEPITIEQIESLAADEIRPLCERYAAMMLQMVQNKYQGNSTHIRAVEVSSK